MKTIFIHIACASVLLHTASRDHDTGRIRDLPLCE